MTHLSAAGLTDKEATAYTALLTHSEWLPSKLAENVSETRTNMYKILDRLVELKLAEKYDKARKLHYRATNPARLLELAHELKQARSQAEKQLDLSVQELTRDFVKVSEQPGIQYFQGKDQIRQIFNDMQQSKTPIYLLRSPADVDFYDQVFFDEFRAKRAANSITTYALTQNQALNEAAHKQDQAYKFIRRVLPEAAYDAPVEWNVYEDKVVIISYGSEALGLTIQSQQIADSVRQMLKYMRKTLG